MKPNTKKLLKNLAQGRLESEQKSPEQVERERREKEEYSKELFDQLKREVFIPLVEDLNEIFKETGDEFLLFSNDQATSFDDKDRIFCQIFFHPKGRPQVKVGLSTASILFECNPLKIDEVNISTNIELRPSALKSQTPMSISELDEEVIERKVSEFVTAVAHVSK